MSLDTSPVNVSVSVIFCVDEDPVHTTVETPFAIVEEIG